MNKRATGGRPALRKRRSILRDRRAQSVIEFVVAMPFLLLITIGSFAVGKTSLVARFVHSIFSEKYHTTVGVKIDRKTQGITQLGSTKLRQVNISKSIANQIRYQSFLPFLGFCLCSAGTIFSLSRDAP